MKKGLNSFMGEIKVLIGVLTGAIAQILNFWFNGANNNKNNIDDLVKKIIETQKEK